MTAAQVKHLAVALLAHGVAQAADDLPSIAELEASGAVVGRIEIARENVFDLTDPEQDRFLYRLANRWHVITREAVIRNQLLFREGDHLESRLVKESERLLRENSFLYDAAITPVAVENGTVDLRVWTRDVWTLAPGLSLSRSGGENRSQVSITERNLLGTGRHLSLKHTKDVDRDSTDFQYYDKNLGSSWTSLYAGFADLSDGHSADIRLIRPFYALDTRWSGGATFLDDDRVVSFYELGDEVAEYRVETSRQNLFYGWSGGLHDGWVSRFTAGLTRDERRYQAVAGGSLPALLPEDRALTYPTLGVELLEDRFEATANRDQIGRTEDFFLGTRLWASVGYAAESLGSDRDAWLYNLHAERGFGSINAKALLLTAGVDGRLESGSARNVTWRANARWYNQITAKRLFFTTLDFSHGERLDLDNYLVLGGDSGLRGYPLRYQSGVSRLLATVEQRYFTDWYPFKLFRIGGAVFADAGRTWGNGPTGADSIGWLRDVGVGLRLASTRSSGRDIIHIDVAFPLDGDPSIDSVQFLIESRRGF